MEKKISKKQLLEELSIRQGLIPYTIDKENFQIKWIDFEKYHFYEGFAWHSLNRFTGLKKNRSAVDFFLTDPAVLEDDQIVREFVSPSAFIFHASRCGSTLLAKALARSRKNLVLSEYPAHNRIILPLTKNGKTGINAEKINKKILRNLILSTARKRLATHQNCIIKFNSYHILFYDFIRRVFPDVPAIFLYREPSGILSSIKKAPMKWIDDKNKKIRELKTNISETKYKKPDSVSYLNEMISELFSTALAVRDDNLTFFNFNDLRADNFDSILKTLDLSFEKNEIRSMKSQFQYYSKSENNLVKFSKKDSEQAEKSVKASAELKALYQRLDQKRSARPEIKNK